MKKITLLHATKGTPEKALTTKKIWLARANQSKNVEHIFGIQADDNASLAAFCDHPYAVTVPPPDWASSSVANWNTASALSTGDILVVIADDLEPPIGWDDELQKLPDGNLPWACYVPDTVREDGLMCHPVLSRELYIRRGYVFHPSYYGVFCDNDFTVRTMLECSVLQVKGLKWFHDHPINGSRAEDDNTRHQNSEKAYAYGGATFTKMWPLYATFQRCRSVESDIHAHLLRLAQLARECSHVTEFGVRSGMSTFSFLHGLSNKSRATLRSYDLGDPYNIFESVRPHVEIDWTFAHGSTLEAPVIEPTELLFIDTLHDYAQVKGELERHGNQASKYIIFHDTVSFGINGETGGPGINLAIQEFMRDNEQWVLFEHYDNNNGLTILTRQ
jgi:hypothetical protein